MQLKWIIFEIIYKNTIWKYLEQKCNSFFDNMYWNSISECKVLCWLFIRFVDTSHAVVVIFFFFLQMSQIKKEKNNNNKWITDKNAHKSVAISWLIGFYFMEAITNFCNFFWEIWIYLQFCGVDVHRGRILKEFHLHISHTHTNLPFHTIWLKNWYTDLPNCLVFCWWYQFICFVYGKCVTILYCLHSFFYIHLANHFWAIIFQFCFGVLNN